MENTIMIEDWINHYIKKLCEIDEVIDSGKNSLFDVKETLNSEFVSRTTGNAKDSLEGIINSSNKTKEDISETVNLLRNILAELL